MHPLEEVRPPLWRAIGRWWKWGIGPTRVRIRSAAAVPANPFEACAYAEPVAQPALGVGRRVGGHDRAFNESRDPRGEPPSVRELWRTREPVQR
jgi:hypothetical protein